MTIPLDDIVFMGRDGYECEEFIRAIHKVAYAAGKIRDDAWMADLALACFSGKALRFYQSLGPEVQCNWQLLRPALLTKYARPDDDDDEVPYDGPRLGHLPQIVGLGQPRTGRIKVIGANSADFDYVGDGNTVYITNGLGAAASASDACTFRYIPGSKLFEIQIKRPGDTYQVLGVHWNTSPSTAIGCVEYALLVSSLDESPIAIPQLCGSYGF
ncbi:hypothetical protein FRC04_004049 [Tulasnella sp. 424]|nr:hypothetical protein FRC04_004049 [Tulasnella sp. 424]